jgi:hypothetical protein
MPLHEKMILNSKNCMKQETDQTTGIFLFKKKTHLFFNYFIYFKNQNIQFISNKKRRFEFSNRRFLFLTLYFL